MTPKPKVSILGEGTWIFGRDIQPGTYQQIGGGQDCYWARLSGLTGDFSELLANHNGRDAVVAVLPSDRALQTNYCGAWQKIG